MKKIILTSASVLCSAILFAQFGPEDSTRPKELDDVVVTATRTERKISNVAVPVRVIDQKTIQQAGSLRLRDILQEQAGLYMTNGFGVGVQMQGLSPDYTLIMVDGEPLVGRTAGVLDLNRVAVGNVRKIEIVKGPSSSLYGSEAMAGVINVITDNSFRKKLNAGIRYGFGNPDKGWGLPGAASTFENLDLSLQGSTTIGKLGIQFFSDANLYDGVSFRLYSAERVPQPIKRFTNQLQLSYRFSQKTKLSLSVRDAYDHIKQEFATTNNGGITHSYGREANNDLNVNAVLLHQFSGKVKNTTRLYATNYNGSQILHFREIADSVYDDEFRQHFYRAENQTDISWTRSTLTAGGGYAIDQVNSTRYDDVSSRKQNTIAYGFAQYEWRPADNMTVIAGVRYDDNKLFAAAFSPKLALRYTVNKKLSLKASVGRGFKAPDFRQLYLNFTNNAAGGYSVFGSIDAVRIIEQLNRLGQIAEIRDDYSKLKQLTPEYSTGINAGGTYTPTDKLSINFNAFRNDIENLIDAREVAIRSNGTQIYSYINVKNAYTQGVELEAAYRFSEKFRVNAGYQYLYTADKSDLQKIGSKTVFTRDDNGFSRLLTKADYVGLPNRSRNMANLKLNYDDQKIFITGRIMYRSKWVVSDADGNGLYNKQDEFAKAYVQLNISAGRQFRNGTRLQGGVDNLLNYRDINNLPNMAGRMIYLSAQFKLIP